MPAVSLSSQALEAAVPFGVGPMLGAVALGVAMRGRRMPFQTGCACASIGTLRYTPHNARRSLQGERCVYTHPSL